MIYVVLSCCHANTDQSSSTRTLLSPQAIKCQSRPVNKGDEMISKGTNLNTLDKF